MEELLTSVFFPKLLYNLAAILLIIALWKLNTNFYRHLMKSDDSSAAGNSLRRSVIKTTYQAARYAILLMGTLTLMQINGINVTSILTGLGIASAVVGLAIQEPLKDMISGFQIVTDHFFKEGDVITYEGKTGVVTFFGIRATKIRVLETNQILTISNRNISEITVVGRDCLIDIPLPYSLSAQESAGVMEQAAERIKSEGTADTCVYEGIQEFADSAIIHRLRMECDPIRHLETKRAARKTVSLVLEDSGIAIPFNQLDVHLDQGGEQ
jgi:small conductance mechanosensitive channel